MDPDNAVVSETDTSNYGLSQGTVDGSGNQEALLTIKPVKLSSFASQTSFTYKCSVTSSQFSNSPASSEVDVVGNVVKLGTLLILYQSFNHELQPMCDKFFIMAFKVVQQIFFYKIHAGSSLD